MKDFWRYCKIINGLFGTSLIIWFISSYITLNKMETRTAVIVSIFLFGSFFLVFLSSLVFYLLTKSILTINEQIRYSLIILIVILYFILLVVAQGNKDFIVLPVFFTAASLIYILKNRKTKKVLSNYRTFR
jgi:hypothetical protein